MFLTVLIIIDRASVKADFTWMKSFLKPKTSKVHKTEDIATACVTNSDLRDLDEIFGTRCEENSNEIREDGLPSNNDGCGFVVDLLYYC